MTLATDHPARLSRVKICLEGLSVGDAFGQLFFSASESLLITTTRGRQLPPPPWHYTDDTVMAVSIVEALRDLGEIDSDDLANRYARRYAEEPNRGYGGTAHSILRRLAKGEPWSRVAPAVFGGQGSQGNGGAMRAGPIGAYYADDVPSLIEAARSSAAPTHAHPEGQAGAIAVALAAAYAWRNRDAVDDVSRRGMLDEVIRYTPDGSTRARLLQATELPFAYAVETAASVLGNGSGLLSEDTVPFALWCAARHLDNYEQALWSTALAGGDMDTTCAIVGSIVALAVGIDHIPGLWRHSREGLPIYISSE